MSSFTIVENINDYYILNLLALGCSHYETITIIQRVTIGELCIKLHSDKFFNLNSCFPVLENVLFAIIHLNPKKEGVKFT